jgi:carbon storage regulator
MLILTRKTGQGFTVGENIEITITEISGDKVRVGINAPRDIKVLRSELSETVESNQQAAGPASAGSLRALAHQLKDSATRGPLPAAGAPAGDGKKEAKE